ncbi:holdfast anchoring protein HfaB [Rhodosalinus sediminis]|uniref:holdfast anchoring protein HfaB n=1 Tax=Rhodosalinus sediminis TaxID=1940533 RepID=UPI00235258A4|nr:holdfast anchoring protein HfaB [Rhodosalinus sediminis]
MTDPRRHTLRAALTAGALALAGCATPPAETPDASGRYAAPIGGAPVVDNATPYSGALDCLAASLDHRGPLPRIAVGRIRDYTGKFDEANGARVTQGAALMAVSALARTGVPLVERLDISVAETELKLANNNLVGDPGGLREIRPASIEGSDLFLVGGITELNYNIGSVAQEAFVSPLGAGRRLYVMNIALDLRLVETESLRVVDVVSYQKQILGRETRAGVFEFFGDTLFDLSSEERALEPMQMAVRAMIEKAVGEMTRRLVELEPGTCAPSPKREAEASPDRSGDLT